MKLNFLLRSIFIFLISIIFYINTNAYEQYMPSYKDTLIVFVHGIGADKYTWIEPDEKGNIKKDSSEDLWRNYFYDVLKIEDEYLKEYSFSQKSGWHERNILELGCSEYKSEASNPECANNQKNSPDILSSLIMGNKEYDKSTGIQDHRSWIEQARWDYKNYLFKDENINPLLNRRWENVYDPDLDKYIPEKIA